MNFQFFVLHAYKSQECFNLFFIAVERQYEDRFKDRTTMNQEQQRFREFCVFNIFNFREISTYLS